MSKGIMIAVMLALTLAAAAVRAIWGMLEDKYGKKNR